MLLMLIGSACRSNQPDEVVAESATSSGGLTTSTSSLTQPTTEAPSITTSLTMPMLSVAADLYLNEAIVLMRTWSINRDNVDWDALEDYAYGIADGAETTEDTHSAIRAALARLGDDHSIFFTPAEAQGFTTGTAIFEDPVVELGDNHIGYASIGRYIGDIGDQADAYATEMSNGLNTVMPDACGWSSTSGQTPAATCGR